MSQWHNQSGRPLSSISWLLAHHKAKLPDRRRYVHKILSRCCPKRIVDIGCGPGLWLDLINELAPTQCEFIGLDVDANAIKYAQSLAKNWHRPVRFEIHDINENVHQIPNADLFLLFNTFPYVRNDERLIGSLKARLNQGGSIVIRQYDGSMVRIGPMPQGQRFEIDSSLHAAVEGSEEFHHYDIDRIFKVIMNSDFKMKDIEFEIFHRNSPYPQDFIDYFNNTIQWTIEYVSEKVGESLETWYQRLKEDENIASYFLEVDLVAILS